MSAPLPQQIICVLSVDNLLVSFNQGHVLRKTLKVAVSELASVRAGKTSMNKKPFTTDDFMSVKVLNHAD